jgi:hypothetical protein
MKNITYLCSMKNILIILTVLIFVIFVSARYTFNEYDRTISRIDSVLTYSLEKAYFEGQKDAIKGDIRIKYNTVDSSYNWVRSPWDNNKAPIFIPTKKLVK